jgi:hypothetical protein
MAQYNQQDSIVRQSTLKFMMEYCKLMNVKLTLLETLKITNILCDYCNKGLDQDMEKVIKIIDKHISNKSNTVII